MRLLIILQGICGNEVRSEAKKKWMSDLLGLLDAQNATIFDSPEILDGALGDLKKACSGNIILEDGSHFEQAAGRFCEKLRTYSERITSSE